MAEPGGGGGALGMGSREQRGCEGEALHKVTPREGQLGHASEREAEERGANLDRDGGSPPGWWLRCCRAR